MPSIDVRFAGNRKQDATVGEFTVRTDQPKKDKGDATAPTPFDYFMVSLATCAGAYAQGFCTARDIDVADLAIRMDYEWDEKDKLVRTIRMAVSLPEGFPEKYHKAILRAIDQCTVKRHLQTPPAIETVIA